MSRHVISEKEIEFPIVIHNELCGSYGDGSNKSLEMVVSIKDASSEGQIGYNILENGKEISTFCFLYNAVIAYNNLP